MNSKYLLILASTFLLISAIFAFDTEKSKRKKYRIVKIYGRKLKPTVPPATESSILTPEMSESRITERRPNQGIPDNAINFGEMNLEDFDINKLLAATGHGGDPSAPKIVQLSAPSSNSHLDPEYLSKLITEQLGHSAEYTILPSLGGEGTNGYPAQSEHRESLTVSPTSGRPPYSAQVSNINKYSTTVAPKRSESYPTQVVKSHYTGRTVTPSPARDYNSVSMKSPLSVPSSSFENVYTESNQNSRPRPTPAYPYIKTSGSPNPIYKQTPMPTYAPPVTPYPQTFREFSTQKPYRYSSPRPDYESVSMSPAKKYPYQPPSPNSKILGYSKSPLTTPSSFISPSKDYSYAKAPDSSSNSHEPLPVPASQYSSQNSGGYSTLGREMTAPGLAPAPKGEYGASGESESSQNYNSPEVDDSREKPKYGTSLIRGFTSGSGGENYESESFRAPKSVAPAKWSDVEPTHTYNSGQNQEVKNQAPAFSSDGYLWTKGPTETFSFLNQLPTKSYTFSSDSAGYPPSNPSGGASFSSHLNLNSFFNPSQGSNQGIPATGFHPSIDNATPETYEPYSPPKAPENSYGQPETPANNYGPPQAPANNYGPPQAPANNYGPPQAPANNYVPPQAPASNYGPPQAPASNSGTPRNLSPSYEPTVEEKRPVLSKTIYVNLPAEPTTPKPHRPPVLPQRHYKIVFIKAPTHPPPEEPEIETTPAPESKTLIYVLHQKPQPPAKIVIPTARPTQPSKPEVHFIQYKDAITTTPSTTTGYDHDRDSGEYGYDSPYTNTGQDGEFGYRTSYSKRSPEVEYDMSSSSSTIHVNMKKSVSDKN